MAGRDRRRRHGKQMSISSPETPRPRLGFAIFLLVVAAVALILSFVHVSGGFATQHDPGPWMLPRLLAVSLLIGGAIQMILELRSRKAKTVSESNTDSAPAAAVSPRWQLPALIVGMAFYVAALPWIGFVMATTVFAALLLIALGVSWWRAILAAVVLSGVAYGLFAVLFKVPLPAGVWN